MNSGPETTNPPSDRETGPLNYILFKTNIFLHNITCSLLRNLFFTLFALHHRMFWANSLNRHLKSQSMIPSKDCTILEHWTPTRYSSQDRWVMDQACSVKVAGYWPSSFLRVYGPKTESRSINSQRKKTKGQYPAILTEQAWSIRDLLYG